jgi:kinesin family protein 13
MKCIFYCNSGQTHENRRHALEKIGISVGSGITVDKTRSFLINLNSDPALNELLVFYLKPDVTRVGRAGDPSNPDIQLSGVGIQPDHCVIAAVQSEADAIPELHLTPLPNARTCVNGIEVHDVVRLRNGDRILWGSNHFFRLNCPKSSKYSCFVNLIRFSAKIRAFLKIKPVLCVRNFIRKHACKL